MSKNNVTTKQWLLKNFFAISAIIVSIANVWLAIKLVPLTLSINKLDGRVLANEHSIGDVGKDLIYIRDRVDDLYNYWIEKK